MDISIVIPAYNEAAKIARDVEEAASFLNSNGLDGEIIVVDDGSSDGTAAEADRASVPPGVGRAVIRLERNSGKGAAVKRGVLESRGGVVLYADSGTCIPYVNALPVIKRIAAGDLDIGLASRRHPGTVIRQDRPLRRRVLSRFFHWAAVRIAGLPRRITDSQCGFKVYRGDAARELFAGLATTGFLFELEVILKAIRRGLRVEEFPVEWTCDLDTRLRPSTQAGSVLKELLKVRSINRRN